MAMRWHLPPKSLIPPSLTTVLYPVLQYIIRLCIEAALQLSTILILLAWSPYNTISLINLFGTLRF